MELNRKAGPAADSDVVVIGAGHNGLVCACYIAAAGLRVTVLERRGIVGGAAVTEEFFPGVRNSTASYTVSLLHPKIIEMIEYAHQKRISTGLSSNLNRLNAELAERLIRSGLSQLLVSLDGATQATYSRYRQGGNLGELTWYLDPPPRVACNEEGSVHPSVSVITWRRVSATCRISSSAMI